MSLPPASQDLAVVVSTDVPAAQVLDVVRRRRPLLREASVFDVYEGDQVPPGKRSLAVRLVLRSADRTLTEKDITGVRRKVLAALERELDATLRQLAGEWPQHCARSGRRGLRRQTRGVRRRMAAGARTSAWAAHRLL